jgi:pimeloyl-ACP methyl ester carboxylesterase
MSSTAPESVTFYNDDGDRIAADLYPGTAQDGVGVVFCHGWGGTKNIVAPTLAAELQSRFPCTALTFDYSGFGQSEGRRGRLDPQREVRDVGAAVSFMLSRFPHMADRIGLYGFSFGGAISTYAASTDDRVAALLAVSGFANGDQLMRDIRPLWQYIEFREKIESDRLARALSGESEIVDPDWILVRDPIAKQFNEDLLKTNPERKFDLDVLSAELICNFDVTAVADRLWGRPSKFVHTERDVLNSPSYSRELATITGGELAILSGFGHYDIYGGDGLGAVSDQAADFFSRSLT